MALVGKQDLPQELVNEIISNLRNDRFSLKRCSLVSRAFTLASQPLLFTRLSLEIADDNPKATEKSIQRFQSILSTFSVRTPSCLEYVQALFLRIGTCGPSVPTLVEIIIRLVNVNRLHLDCRGCNKFSEPLIYHICKPAVAHIVLLNSFTSAFPSHHLRRCTSLQGLFILSSELTANNSIANLAGFPESSTSNPPVPIKSLTVHTPSGHIVEDWLGSPDCPITFQSLTSLSLLNLSTRDFRAFAQVLPSVSGALESLKISPPANLTFQALGIDHALENTVLVDLSALTRLKRLTFIIHELHFTFFPWIISQLLTVSTPNSLGFLRLEIVTDVTPPFDIPTFRKKWEKLDSTLADARFDDLRDMQILIEPDGYQTVHAKHPVEYFTWLGKVLLKTRQRKKLLIGSEVNSQEVL
ncbi:hypothetical protein AX16_010220 [Volvariella volvacea WC 439]|nr:hypothetical protein AX16_010220 [Volvariella volvacea WC 439]